jgi:hypothetical protein
MDAETAKAEIDKMSRVQCTMTAVALLITQAYHMKERIAPEQFVDVLKAGLETLANTADYEARIKVLDVISEAAPKHSLPVEIAAVMIAAIDRLGRQSQRLHTAHEQMKNLMEMLRDARTTQ